MDVESARFATLRGRVLDPGEEPAAGVKVEVGPFTDVETDSEGRFTLTDLRPGTYTIRAVVGSSTPTPQGISRTEFVPTYFPSATDQVDAERITVRGGADLAGFEIRLRTSPVFRVSGALRDENGKPIAGASVKLLKPSPGKLLSGMEMMFGVQSFLNLQGPEPEGMSIATDKDGRFEFSAVRPGNWLLQAEQDARRDEANDLYILATGTIPA